MKIYIASDKEGLLLKNSVKKYIINRYSEYEIVDLTHNGAEDFVDSSRLIAESLKEDTNALGILIDETGAGSFMTVTKFSGITAAEVSDEHSAKMTRSHNNARVITMGQGIVGPLLANRIAEVFLEADYAGGRHQIRVDMLDAMC